VRITKTTEYVLVLDPQELLDVRSALVRQAGEFDKTVSSVEFKRYSQMIADIDDESYE